MAKTDFEETLSLADIQELTVHCAGGSLVAAVHVS